MKKLRTALLFILCLLTAFTFMVTVSADSISYKIDDLKMTISIPDTMTVKTKENSQDLTDGIYLEAVEPQSSLIISVSMVQDAETIKIDTFADKPYSLLEDYKERMEDLGFSEGKDGNYGGVPFLDFSQKTTSESGLDIYTRHSITLINGMSISIVSQSPGDNFTSDELSVIKSCLDSIRFETASENVTAGSVIGKVILWIVIILLIMGAVLLLLSYYMGKRNTQKKREFARERSKNADYDVLKKADASAKQKKQGLGGYKTSSDFFDDDFETSGSTSTDTSSPSAQPPSKADIAVKETKTAVTHMGYFLRNLKKELSGNKKSKGKSKKAKRQAVDYDIFNEK